MYTVVTTKCSNTSFYNLFIFWYGTLHSDRGDKRLFKSYHTMFLVFLNLIVIEVIEDCYTAKW